MQNKYLCTKLFIKAVNYLNYKNINNNVRILKEEDYFEAYIEFINNSIHYSRFSYSTKGKVIKGKYLNEKVNKWRKAGIFEKMYEYKILDYKNNNIHNKHFHIDGHIVTNRYGIENTGRCVYYKSKNGYNLQTITDDSGITFGLSAYGANDNESKLLIPTFNKSYVDDANKYINSKKYVRYFTADAGYDNIDNDNFLSSKGYIPLIWRNKRNSSEEIFKKKKMNKNQSNHYKKRHIIENSYSWLETKIPRLSKIYDKFVGNYINMVYMAIIDMIICRECA